MGATNRAKTGYVAEATKGTTPATPAIKALRLTSDSLVMTPTRVTSSEIRSDRQISDQILTALNSGGSIGIEFSFNAFDDMIEAALQGTWVSNPTALVTALTTTTATIASGGATYLAGMLILTTGFANAANNNIITPVVSNTGTTVVCAAASFTAEASPPAAAAIRVVGFQGASGDIVATVTGGNAFTSTAIDFTTLGIAAGEWIKVGGDAAPTQWATAACNGWYRVSAITAHRLSFDLVPASFAADAGTSKTIQMFMGDDVNNGTTQRSFTFERQQTDLTSPSYEYFTGQQVDKLSLDLKAAAVVTGSIAVVGMSGSASTTRFAGATDVTAPTYSVLNAASNVGRLAMDGTLISGPSYLMDLAVNLNNNLAGQPAINNISPIGVRNGECNVSGNLTAYFNDLTLLNKVLLDSDTALMFRAGRSDGNRESILVDIPAAKISGTAPVSAKNTDRMFSGTYAAKRHSTLGYTIAMMRFWYLPVAVSG